MTPRHIGMTISPSVSNIVTFALSTVRETSLPADSVTMNVSSDSGVVSWTRGMVTIASIAPGIKVKDPLVLITSVPSIF